MMEVNVSERHRRKIVANFLSKLMFLLPLPILLLLLCIGMLVSLSGDSPIELAFMIVGSEYPHWLRLQGLALNFLWGSMCIFFIALARLYRLEYPIKSTFLAAMGIGFIIPMSAGNHRTNSNDRFPNCRIKD